jgi:NADP-dependent 3-hydroxy acid dehydrogenase YdfG
MNSFKAKGVVITGAASGIGEALARNLAAQGARLLLADVDTGRLDAVVAELRAGGADCLAQPCDVADVAAVQALADTALQAWGGADVLINNAGVGLVAPVHSLDLADAHWLMNINFWGVVHGSRAFTPQLQARPGSVIVNISSIFAMVSMPTQSIYNASKAAVRGFSDALREELRASGVRVLCVHPGGIQTAAQQARLGDISPCRHAAGTACAVRSAARTTAPQVRWPSGRRCKAGTRLLIGADAKMGDLLYRLATRAASARAAQARRRLTSFQFLELRPEPVSRHDLNPVSTPLTGVLTRTCSHHSRCRSAWLAVRSQLSTRAGCRWVWRTSTLAGSTDADSTPRGDRRGCAVGVQPGRDDVLRRHTDSGPGAALALLLPHQRSGPGRALVERDGLRRRPLPARTPNGVTASPALGSLDGRGHFAFETGPTARGSGASRAVAADTRRPGPELHAAPVQPGRGPVRGASLAGRAHDRATGELRMNLLRYLRIRNPWYCRLEVLAAVALLTHVLVVWAIPYVIMAALSASRPAEERGTGPLLPPMTDATSRRVVMPSPDLLQCATCAFDAEAQHPADPHPPGYWSIALVRGQLRQLLRAQRPPPPARRWIWCWSAPTGTARCRPVRGWSRRRADAACC